MGFHHAEWLTGAEVLGFTGDVVVMRRYRDFVIVLSGVIGHTQLFRVKELPHITANFPWVIFTGYTTMIVNTVSRGCQCLLWLLTGFAIDVNLHGGQVIALECDGIAAASGAHI